MHPPETRDAALALIAGGVNDCGIARRLGVARTTVRDWRAPRYEPKSEIPRGVCLRCWRSAKGMLFTPDDYAFLFGLYLGDGCISRMSRTFRLRISLDTKYPGIIAETEQLLTRCFPFSPVGTLVKDHGSCAVVGVYSNHLPCLFPQHGPGKKHERSIDLEPWQLDIVNRSPWSLLRGLVWSDGCSFVNRTGKYEYLSFGFSNMSSELIALFGHGCELVGVSCRLYPPRRTPVGLTGGQARVNRRDDVAQFEKHVGIKR